APRRRLQAPDAASRLHAGLDAAAEALDLAQVLAVLEGGVEVDDVQAPGPERDEALSGLEGPRVVDGLALRVALVEPHGPAAPDVDAGDALEPRQGDYPAGLGPRRALATWARRSAAALTAPFPGTTPPAAPPLATRSPAV